MALGATYKAISPLLLGDSKKIEHPHSRHPNNGPEVLSQYVRDLDGNNSGPMRERVRHTPYHVKETKVARNADERREEVRACCILRREIPRKSNSVFIGRYI